MADQQVKIMDLGIATPVPTDWIPFVDISDTTQSAEGSTKRALKSELQGADGLDITWLGAYNAGTGYVVNDAISYSGSSYICKLSSTGNIPTNGTYWDLMAQKGTDGAGAGDMLKSENLSGLTDYATARSNLGLGSLATQSGTFSDKEDIANKSTSVTTDLASNTKYPSVKSVYDWAVGAFAKYSGDADFYQYSIVRTVASGNLTVALKNYEGNDPTTLKPVKIMIGGVMRTITSGANLNPSNFGGSYVASGSSWLNLGSAELATKEVDLFLYFCYDSTLDRVGVIFSRYPSANTFGDFTTGSTNEKGMLSSPNINPIGSDPVVNIGRFNAILSGGAGYTWSIPATSVIVNRPIYETRNILGFDSTITAKGSMTVSSPVKGGVYYKIQGDMMEAVVSYSMTLGGTASNEVYFTIPFSINNVVSYTIEGGGIYYNTTDDYALTCSMNGATKNLVRIKKYDASVFTLSASQDIKFMVRGRI